MQLLDCAALYVLGVSSATPSGAIYHGLTVHKTGRPHIFSSQDSSVGGPFFVLATCLQSSLTLTASYRATE
jgi:hypothetical protein